VRYSELERMHVSWLEKNTSRGMCTWSPCGHETWRGDGICIFGIRFTDVSQCIHAALVEKQACNATQRNLDKSRTRWRGSTKDDAPVATCGRKTIAST
jgi:hypothetical protein